MKTVRMYLVLSLCCAIVLILAGCEDIGGDSTTTTSDSTTTSAMTSVTAQPSTTVTESELSDEEAALLEAVDLAQKAQYGPGETPPSWDLSLDAYKIVDSWAGVWVYGTESDGGDGAFECALLLVREGAGWRVVDAGTGMSAEDWMASGAPRELAEWF